MALFDKFKKGGKGEGGEDQASESVVVKAGYQPQPEKAQGFYKHAQAAHDSTQYGYAMTLWLKGIRFDADNVGSIERFAASATRMIEKTGGKAKGPTSDQRKGLPDDKVTKKYLEALLVWGGKGFDWHSAFKAMQEANKLGCDEVAHWLGERVMSKLGRDPKAKKDHWVELMRQFEECNGFEMAVAAGERAMELAPTDGDLASDVKNLSAQSAMAEGGFDNTKEGGFRGRIRDNEKQREIVSEESLVKTEGELEAQIKRAAASYSEHRTDRSAIEKYARLLQRRGSGDDLKRAYKVLMQGHKDTSLYTLKEQAGEVELAYLSAVIHKLEAEAKARPDDEELQEKLEETKSKRHQVEVREYTERTQNYPTDLKLKYHLGRLHFNAGNYEQAIEQLQKARDAQGVRGQVLRLLAYSFLELGWIDESVSTFRGALESHRTPDDDLGLQLRYGLMLALKRQADENEDPAAAEDAYEIASKIAIQNIGYRDIRQQRDELVELRKKLKDAG